MPLRPSIMSPRPKHNTPKRRIKQHTNEGKQNTTHKIRVKQNTTHQRTKQNTTHKEKERNENTHTKQNYKNNEKQKIKHINTQTITRLFKSTKPQKQTQIPTHNRRKTKKKAPRRKNESTPSYTWNAASIPLRPPIMSSLPSSPMPLA